MIQNTEDRDGTSVSYLWKPLTSYSGIEPIVQVYGTCFTKDGRVCVIRNPLLKNLKWEGGFTPWCLPGGSPEGEEKPEETLAREVDEEIDCDISNLKLLGANEVFFPNNPNKKKGDHYFQPRYFAIIENIREQTPDPDDGQMVERKFIDPEEFTEYVKWGDLSEAVIEAAIKEFNAWKQNSIAN